MKILLKNLSNPHFDDIKNKKKTIEGRLGRGDWKDISPSDLIFFENSGELILCKVNNVYISKTFANLFEKFGEKLLPGVKETEDAVNIYRDFFTKIEEKEYSVIGIEVELKKNYKVV